MYDVFISYSRKDYYDEATKCVKPDNVVSKIMKLFDENEITYWFDDKDIRGGDSYADEIVENIENSKIFLFISTENSNESFWTRKEISIAVDDNKYIIPFRYDDSKYDKSVRFRIIDLEDIRRSKWGEKSYDHVLFSVKSYLEKIKNEETKKEEEHKKAERIKVLVKDIESLKGKHTVIDGEVKDLSISIKLKKNTYNDLVLKINQAEDELFKLKNESRDHEPFQLYSDDDEKSKERIKELESQINTLNNEKQKLLSKIELLENNVVEYKKKNEDISEKMSGCEEEIARLKDENSSAKSKNDVLERNLDEKGKEKDELLKKIAAIEKELDSFRNEKKLAEEKSRFQDKTIMYKGIPIEMVAVKGGTFWMGAQKKDPKGRNYDSEAFDDEAPVHQVTLSDYYIGKFEVTQELWQAVMGNNPSYFKGDKLLVEQVSWNDCQDFIRKLNQLTGANFRLPTEAEWEYAARGGNKSRGYKYSGSNSIGEVAWYDGNSGSKTHQVGTKSPNELGIYDMSGNVWEWCQDWYGRYSSGSQTNPKGASSGSYRVLRGGSWIYSAMFCRVSCRSSYYPDKRSYDYGFRLAIVP